MVNPPSLPTNPPLPPTLRPYFLRIQMMQPQKKVSQPLQNCIGNTICIGQEIICLPYAGVLQLVVLL